eukprot:3170455-Prymnesium_polylepis.1
MPSCVASDTCRFLRHGSCIDGPRERLLPRVLPRGVPVPTNDDPKRPRTPGCPLVACASHRAARESAACWSACDGPWLSSRESR